MSQDKYCDRWVDVKDWCEKNGFDPDKRYDEEEAPYKRGVQKSFALKHKELDHYVSVQCDSDYDWGESAFTIFTERQLRVEVPVTTVQIKYVKADV